jgi:hypothetical protein
MAAQVVKKPKSNYLIFCEEQRLVIKQKNPQIKNTEIIQECGRLWKLLPPEQKDVYTQKYLVLKSACESEKEVVSQAPVKECKQEVQSEDKCKTKAKNPYITFCSSERKKIKEQFPGLGPKDVSKKLGEAWNLLSNEEKLKYNSEIKCTEVVKQEVCEVKCELKCPVEQPQEKKKAKKPRKVQNEPILTEN